MIPAFGNHLDPSYDTVGIGKVQREESTTGAIIALAQGGKFQGAPDRWPRLDAHSRADELSEGLPRPSREFVRARLTNTALIAMMAMTTVRG
jgi:hypothetical protein